MKRTRDSRSTDQWLQVEIDRLKRRLKNFESITGSYPGAFAANPTASVILTTVPGSAVTYMRSDAAPPLSQAISPTMTGTWNYTPSSTSVASVTINAVASQTAAMQRWNPLLGYDTIVTKDGYVGVGDESPTAMVSIRAVAASEPSTYLLINDSDAIINLTNGAADQWLYPSNADWSVEMLLMFPVGFAANMVPCGHGGSNTAVSREQWMWRLSMDSTGHVRGSQINTHPTSGPTYACLTAFSSADMRDGLWHHYRIACVHGPTRSISLYIDDVLIGTATNAGTDNMGTNFTGLPTGFNYIKFGCITDVGGFGGNATGMGVAGMLVRSTLTAIRSPSSTVEIVPAGTIGTYSNVIRYWPMTDGSGQSIADLGTGFSSTFNGRLGSLATPDANDPTWATGGGGSAPASPLTHWKTSTGSVDSIMTNSRMLGLGTETPATKFQVVSSSEQIRFGTSLTNYTGFLQPTGPATITYTMPTVGGLGILHNSAGNVWSWSAINLAADVGTSVLPLANGGTSKALTAANGGVVYSDADSMEILAPTATAGQILRSGSNAAPSWSTATYASTYVSGDILIASAANVVTGLAISGSSGKFLRSNGTAPSWQAIASTDISDFNEAAQDAVGGILTDSASIDFTYNDAGGTITATVISGVVVPAPHNLLSATHGDTVAASPVRGDLIGGNSTPSWQAFGYRIFHDYKDPGDGANANLFIGKNAGNFTMNGSVGSEGTSNYAFGENVLDALTTGLANFGGGLNALTACTSGRFNVAIGENALSSLTTGRENAAYGYGALQSVTQGWYNFGQGTDAGLTITTGSSNILIGTYSDVDSSAASNRIGLGFAVVVDADDKVVIGNTAAETASTGTAVVELRGQLQILDPLSGFLISFDTSGPTADVTYTFPVVNNGGQIWVDTSGVETGLSGLLEDPILTWIGGAPGVGAPFTGMRFWGSGASAARRFDFLMETTGLVTATAVNPASTAGWKFTRSSGSALTTFFDVDGTFACDEATVTSVNKVFITAPATSATLTIAEGKTFTVSNSIQLIGTDAQQYTFPTTSATIARTDAAQTFTGVQTFLSRDIHQDGINLYTSGQIVSDTQAGTSKVGVTIFTDVADSGTAGSTANIGLLVRNNTKLTNSRPLLQVDWASTTGTTWQPAFQVYAVQAAGSTKEMKLLSDTSNHLRASVTSVGVVTFTATGSAPTMTFTATNGLTFTASTGAVQVTGASFSMTASSGAMTFNTSTTATITASTSLTLDSSTIYVKDAATIQVASPSIGMKIGASGDKIGFYSVAPVARPAAYTPTNVTTDRSYNANSTTIDELADVLGTLIGDLQSLGLVQ